MPLKTSVEMEEKVEKIKEKREQLLHPVYPSPTLIFRMEKGAKYFGLILHALRAMITQVTFHFDEDEAWVTAGDPTGVYGVYLTLNIENLVAYNPTEELVRFELWKYADILKHVKKGEPLEVYLHGDTVHAMLKLKRGTFKLSLIDNDECEKMILKEVIPTTPCPIEFMSKGADWKMALKTFAMFKPERIYLVSDGENMFLRVVSDDLLNDEGEMRLTSTKNVLEKGEWLFNYNALYRLLDFFPTDVRVKINYKGAALFHLEAHAFNVVIIMAGTNDEDDFIDDGEFDDI